MRFFNQKLSNEVKLMEGNDGAQDKYWDPNAERAEEN